MGGITGKVIPCSVTTTTEYYGVDKDFDVYKHLYKPKMGGWGRYCTGQVKQVEHGKFWNGMRYMVGLGTNNENMYMHMFHTTTTDKSWQKITSKFKVTMFYLDGDTLYGLGEEDGAIYVCVIYNIDRTDCYASAWNPLTKGGMSSFTVYGGTLYAVGKNNQVWATSKSGGGGWSQKTQGKTGITQVEVMGETIYGLGLDTKIYHWYAGQWRPLTPEGATQFVLSAKYIHALLEDGCLWRADRVNGTDKWEYVAGPKLIQVARPFGALESRM